MLSSSKKEDIKAWLVIIVTLVFVAALVIYIVWYAIFYWTSCAFVPAAEAPAICYIGNK